MKYEAEHDLFGTKLVNNSTSATGKSSTKIPATSAMDTTTTSSLDGHIENGGGRSN